MDIVFIRKIHFSACAWCKWVVLHLGKKEFKVPFIYKFFESHGICSKCSKQVLTQSRKVVKESGN